MNPSHGATPSHGPAPRPVRARQVLMAVLAVIGCPSAAIATVILVGGRQVPLPHLVFCLLQLVLLVPLVLGAVRWFRPARASRPSDAVPPVLFLVAAALTLAVTRLRAYQDGIQGSALPRALSGQRYGVPLSVDLLYLAATGLGVLAVLAAAAGIALLVWHAPPVRRLRGRGQDLAAEMAQAVLHPAEGEIPARAAGPPIVTRAGEPFLRRHLSPLSRALLLLGVVATPASFLLLALAHPSPGVSDLLLLLAVLAPVAGVAWAVLASLWRRDETLGIVRAALLRTLVLPLLTAAGALPTMLATLLPSVRQGFAAQRLVAAVDDQLLPTESSMFASVALTALITVGASILAGLAITVVAVMPITAVFMPQVMVGDNDMSTAPEHRRQNIAAVRALSLLIVLIFVFSILITNAEPDEARFWIAMAVLLVMAALTWYIWRTQKVDHARRRAHGTSARAPGPEELTTRTSRPSRPPDGTDSRSSPS